MTFHLQDEDVEPVLIKDKTAEVNLSEDAWISADYSDTVEADYFDPRNVTFLTWSATVLSASSPNAFLGLC